MQGKVLKLFITHNDEKKRREEVPEIVVDENGIKEDKFYAKNQQRAILITSMYSYDLTKENQIEIPHGSLGENILVDINPYHLLPGEQILIGETLLEITQNCTLCKGLSTLNSKLPKLLKDDRGIFAKVVNGTSQIKISDGVRILNH